MSDFQGLEDTETKLIDPFRVANLQRDRETLQLVLPLSNFKRPEDDCLRTSFRRQIDDFLWSKETCHRENDPGTSLMGTLIELAQLRPDRDAPPGQVKIHRCPSEDCDAANIYLDPEEPEHNCPRCGNPLFISDCLRLWEVVSDFHPNKEPASRFMSYIEHLLPIHYLRFLADEAPAQLNGLGILVDGPLAVFGHAAWLHYSIMRFLYQLRERQRARGLKMPVIIGIQKSGYVVEYMRLLNQYIPNNQLFSITDEFRYKYLGIEKSANGFGSETYYGHDFSMPRYLYLNSSVILNN
jgi:hypothetical protein